MLPDINGKEVCQRVRSDKTMDDVRIICISGMVEEDKIEDLKAVRRQRLPAQAVRSRNADRADVRLAGYRRRSRSRVEPGCHRDLACVIAPDAALDARAPALADAMDRALRSMHTLPSSGDTARGTGRLAACSVRTAAAIRPAALLRVAAAERRRERSSRWPVAARSGRWRCGRLPRASRGDGRRLRPSTRWPTGWPAQPSTSSLAERGDRPTTSRARIAVLEAISAPAAARWPSPDWPSGWRSDGDVDRRAGLFAGPGASRPAVAGEAAGESGRRDVARSASVAAERLEQIVAAAERHRRADRCACVARAIVLVAARRRVASCRRLPPDRAGSASQRPCAGDGLATCRRRRSIQPRSGPAARNGWHELERRVRPDAGNATSSTR